MKFRRVPVSLAIVAAVVGCGAVSGCGGDGTEPTAASSAPPAYAPPASESASPGAEQTEAQTKTPKVTTHRPKDPLAPGRIRPVVRDGKRPHPTVTAAPATFKGVSHYEDGVSLRVTDIRHGHVTDEGPGAVKGPTTTFKLALTNGSSRALQLNSVVVTAVYGTPGRIARPIYLSQSQDFAGTTKPGRTAKAVYTFGISVPRSANVTIHVDFDAVHQAAVFTGSAR